MGNSPAPCLLFPQTPDQAWEMFRDEPRSLFLAGGTDLVPLMKKRLKAPPRIVSLGSIPELSRIEDREEGLFIGASTPLSRIVGEAKILDLCPALAAAAGMAASPQIRNQGTLGGNVCQDRRCIYFNQTRFWRSSLEPCFKTGGAVCHQRPGSPVCRAVYHSDTAPVLLAARALVLVLDSQGTRPVPAAEFIQEHITRNGTGDPGAGLVLGFILPWETAGSWIRFARAGVRSSLDFAVLNAALGWSGPGENSSEPKVSLVAGAVAPEPVTLTETQDLIRVDTARGVIPCSSWTETALDELSRKSGLIKDTGLSPMARKKAFNLVGLLFQELRAHLQGETG